MKESELKFKLGQKVVYNKRLGTVIGIELDGMDDRPYVVVYTDCVPGDDYPLSQVLKMDKYVDKWHPDAFIYEKNSFEWLCDKEIKSLDEEKHEIIDSVNTIYVRRFPSGAVRSDDRGRENPSFISPYALKFCAEHFSANAAFFNDIDSAKNYFKGIRPIDIEASLMRHVVEFEFNMMPHRRNRDKIKQSLVEIMANCVMGLHQIGLEEDGEYLEPFEKMEYIKKED